MKVTIIAKIKEIVDSGRYSCIEDFVATAIREKLEREKLLR